MICMEGVEALTFGPLTSCQTKVEERFRRIM